MSRGARGFSQQPPDLTSRLVGPPGNPAPQGAAPYRYYNPSGRRRALRDGRGRPLTPVSKRAPEVGETDGLGREARMLARVLNDAIGINIRQPSSHAPPFRARQWSFNTTFEPAPATTQAISFYVGQTTVSEGVRGVVSDLEFYAYTIDQDALFSPSNMFGTLLKNGALVPGWEDILPGMTINETTTDANGSDSRGAVIRSPKVCVPIQLQPGDTLSFVAERNGVVLIQVMIRLCGWFYPIEQQADNVTGTVADRGNIEGLIRRGGY